MRDRYPSRAGMAANPGTRTVTGEQLSKATGRFSLCKATLRAGKDRVHVDGPARPGRRRFSGPRGDQLAVVKWTRSCPVPECVRDA